MQPNLVKRLYTLTIQELDVCPNYRDFKDTVKHNCSTIFGALGDYRDFSISKHALPTKDFPRPQILLERLRKRVHGFMSMRQPLVDDHGPHQDVPRHSIALVTSGRSTSSSYIPTPPTRLCKLWFFFFHSIIIVYSYCFH